MTTHPLAGRGELQLVALGTGVVNEEPVGLCVVALVGTNGFVGGGDRRVGNVSLWGQLMSSAVLLYSSISSCFALVER